MLFPSLSFARFEVKRDEVTLLLYASINQARGPHGNICSDVQGVCTERSEVHAP